MSEWERDKRMIMMKKYSLMLQTIDKVNDVQRIWKIVKSLGAVSGAVVEK